VLATNCERSLSACCVMSLHCACVCVCDTRVCAWHMCVFIGLFYRTVFGQKRPMYIGKRPINETFKKIDL